MNEMRSCTKCVLDTTVPDIEFNEQGICNYCTAHDELIQKHPLNKEGHLYIEALVNKIKKDGKNKNYDCIVGVSGGVDSTYTLYKVVELGLRPLAVTFDNGWNSEIAVSNIKSATSKLNVDLFTYVVDWEEFKDIQLSFLKASVRDGEAPTDIGIKGTLYRLADKEKIGYIINGGNFRTEGQMPRGWTYMDGKYIRNIQKKFGTKKIKKYPNLTMSKYIYYIFIKKIKIIRLLNYIQYDKVQAKQFLQKELDWKDYGGKHYESIYTRFHNGYLCYSKFKFDKRKVEFSALIRSGQMTRDAALKQLKQQPYPEKQVQEDIEYVIKKFGLTKKEFNEILSIPPKTFMDYPTYYPLITRAKPLLNFVSKYVTRL